jgi:diguanylate cyclase (GGDEF)-like protein/PAS domain S-box-containing protein
MKSIDEGARMETSYEGLLAQVLTLQTAVDHVGAYVYAKDVLGRYTYANSLVCARFACSLQDVVGATDAQFFDLSVYNHFLANDRCVLTHGEKVEVEEITMTLGATEPKIAHSVKLPLRNANGEIVGLCGISTDITERRRLENTLLAQKTLLGTVLNNLEALVYMKDLQRRYLYANINAAELFGHTQDSIVGLTDAQLISQAEADRLGVMDQRVFDSGQKSTGEETLVDADGVTRHYWSIKVPIATQGVVDAYVGISTDITEVVQLKNQFRLLANTDALTGVLSRRHLLERAEQELRRARRAQTPIAAIAFDIDHFKQVNDGFGHSVGDRAIIAVVEACQSNLRETDLFGRLGGDEFVVLAVDSDLPGALALAERMRQSVESAVCLTNDGYPVRLSSSFGVVMSEPDVTLDDLLSHADGMLYRAKRAGRNRVWHQTGDMP